MKEKIREFNKEEQEVKAFVFISTIYTHNKYDMSHIIFERKDLCMATMQAFH